MLIQKVSTTKRGYGGNVYEWYLEDFLSKNYTFKKVDLSFYLRGWWRLFEFPLFSLRVIQANLLPQGFLIRNSQAAYVPARRHRCLTIVYHIDETLSPLGSRLFQKVMEVGFFAFTRKDAPIVVISRYWEQYFRNRGFSNVSLIYCPFEIDKYRVSQNEITEFKERHGLGKRPLVYLGNPQPKKGAHLAYQALKNEGYDLVTSGEGSLVLPKARHMNLSFHDYVLLLAASDVVVTLSQFKEGWCRVAHEAILVGTPVVGSGSGGMEEILNGAGQTICTNLADLAPQVRASLKNGRVPESAICWARTFNLSEFERGWGLVLSEAIFKCVN